MLKYRKYDENSWIERDKYKIKNKKIQANKKYMSKKNMEENE